MDVLGAIAEVAVETVKEVAEAAAEVVKEGAKEVGGKIAQGTEHTFPKFFESEVEITKAEVNVKSNEGNVFPSFFNNIETLDDENEITEIDMSEKYEPFWNLVEKHDLGALLVAEDKPWSMGGQEKKSLPPGGYSVKSMRNAFECAEIDKRLFEIMQNADARAMLRVILINEYLTNQPTRTMPDFNGLIMVLPLIALVA